MADILHLPTRYNDAKRREEQEHKERVALSSHVRHVSKEDFDKVQREHDEAVIRQQVLEALAHTF